MIDELHQLQASFAAMRAELDATKARLAKLESVITFDQDSESDTHERVIIECTDLVVRQCDDRRYFAVHLGSTDHGGYIDVHYHGEEHAHKTAISLAIHEDGEPHMQLRGRDYKFRSDTFIQNDHGTMVVLAPDNAPGAVMRALPGGGSIAVLQPDGRARAVLIHDQNHQTGDSVSPNTDLLFATADSKTVLKFNASEKGGLISVGNPEHSNAVSILSQESGPSIMLNSPNGETSATISALENLARIAVNQGRAFDKLAEASLSAGTFGGSVIVSECDGTQRIDLHAAEGSGSLTLLDDDGKKGIALSHFAGKHSRLEMQGTAAHPCVQLLTDQDVTAFALASPAKPETNITTIVPNETPVTTILRKESLPLLFLGEGKEGGVVSAFGAEAEKTGIATLNGGPITGCISVSTPDGTPQLTLDGTDYGGRMMINNDLGFQRIVMGVYEESAGLHLNHTGSLGVQAVATPEGGIVCVCDDTGKLIETLPKHKGDDGPNDHWGKLPDSD